MKQSILLILLMVSILNFQMIENILIKKLKAIKNK
mgnify:CR=1 FL=1